MNIEQAAEQLWQNLHKTPTFKAVGIADDTIVLYVDYLPEGMPVGEYEGFKIIIEEIDGNFELLGIKYE